MPGMPARLHLFESRPSGAPLLEPCSMSGLACVGARSAFMLAQLGVLAMF